MVLNGTRANQLIGGCIPLSFQVTALGSFLNNGKPDWEAMKKDNRLGFIKGRLDAALGSLQRIGDGGSVQKEAAQLYQQADKVIFLA